MTRSIEIEDEKNSNTFTQGSFYEMNGEEVYFCAISESGLHLFNLGTGNRWCDEDCTGKQVSGSDFREISHGAVLKITV